MSLEIASYNIQYGKHIEKVAKWVDEKQLDIVCFQEFPESQLGIFNPQYQGIFTPSFNKGAQVFGELTIYKPKLQLLSSYELDLGVKNKSLLSSATGRRSAMVASFGTEMGVLVLANIHLEWLARAQYKLAQLEKVLTSIDKTFSNSQDMTLIVGDCNFSTVFSGKGLENYVRSRGYTTGPRLTTHRFFGVHHQVDYLIYSGCRLENITTEKTGHSDHHPTLATLTRSA